MYSDYIDITHSNNTLKGVVESVRVYDVLVIEHLVSYATTLLRKGNMRLDVSGLAPGVYFVSVGSTVQKFVKI